MLPVLKLLTPTVLNGIVKYVFEKNPLDLQMEAVIEKLENKETQISMILERVRVLEENSHPKRDFVRCRECEKRIKDAESVMKRFGDETT
jgi:hypothetical protein